MVEVNAPNRYEIETPQFVFCIKPYEGAAVWTDGARRIEIGKYIVLYCETGNLEAIDKRGGHYLVCKSIINVSANYSHATPLIGLLLACHTTFYYLPACHTTT
jgi:hypothetical protein